MTLAQLFDWCNKKSYFSRDDDEIWQALNTAALQIYTEVLNENSGYFIVWDTSSLALVAGTDAYDLPAAVEQMVRLRESLDGGVNDPWKVVSPSDLNSETFEQAQFFGVGDSNLDQASSEFTYYGPYSTQAHIADGTFIKTVKFAPMPQDNRKTELVYTAKFVEITGAESFCVIDPPGHNALKYLAVAELLASNDDDNADRFEGKGNTHKTQYLKLVRARQRTINRQVEPFINDMD